MSNSTSPGAAARLDHGRPERTGEPEVVYAAGTSDLPVAAEAAGTLEAFGAPVELVVDTGVAGIHRISVVNIDNGFGAALVARRILRARR